MLGLGALDALVDGVELALLVLKLLLQRRDAVGPPGLGVQVPERPEFLLRRLLEALGMLPQALSPLGICSLGPAS